jgi:hypothetical protein
MMVVPKNVATVKCHARPVIDRGYDGSPDGDP